MDHVPTTTAPEELARREEVRRLVLEGSAAIIEVLERYDEPTRDFIMEYFQLEMSIRASAKTWTEDPEKYSVLQLPPAQVWAALQDRSRIPGVQG